jgi:hypothetical protein
VLTATVAKVKAIRHSSLIVSFARGEFMVAPFIQMRLSEGESFFLGLSTLQKEKVIALFFSLEHVITERLPLDTSLIRGG